mgnify:CR=1 FL=1|tara:strand:- start:38 stop:694 length:657 start_codon:yes stop_codon:yes gene_type:complete
MAFPPEFSSTLTYANRYDLDEIDIFLEGNSSKPMFFSVSGLPKQLSFGKHYFNLSTLDSTKHDYELRSNSRILFEFKSKNNVVIKSDVTLLKQKNGVANCFVEVLQDPLRTWMDIEDGEGTLTIVGSLQNKQGRGQSIPEKFREAINYRCIFTIEIRKNLINADSPTSLQSEHKSETALGRFSFAKASTSTRAGSIRGTIYNSTGAAASIHDVKGGSS